MPQHAAAPNGATSMHFTSYQRQRGGYLVTLDIVRIDLLHSAQNPKNWRKYVLDWMRDQQKLGDVVFDITYWNGSEQVK